MINNKDGTSGPTVTGSVLYDYYAPGASPAWFDAISLTFDASGYDPRIYNAKLIINCYFHRGIPENITKNPIIITNNFKKVICPL
jgi:hypothetical protein